MSSSLSVERKLDRADGPLYRQAAERLRAAIGGGQVPPGEELPTEAMLSEMFGISLITVRHALRELEADGLIRKRAAKAALVISANPRSPAARTLNSLQDIVAAASGAQLRIVSYRPRRSTEATEAFGLPARTACPCLSGLMLLEGKAVSEITIFFPPSIGQRLTRGDFDDVVVFRSVERRLGLRLTGARITVGAELADAGVARNLGCTEGSAILVNRMIYLDDKGNPVELTIARHRADRYRLSYEFRNA